MAELIFPPKTINLMKQLGVSENDVQDVYNSGTSEKTTTGSHKMWEKIFKYRPIEMFFEEVEVGGVKQPRFNYIGSEMLDRS